MNNMNACLGGRHDSRSFTGKNKRNNNDNKWGRRVGVDWCAVECVGMCRSSDRERCLRALLVAPSHLLVFS